MTADPLSHNADADLVGTNVNFDVNAEFDNGVASAEGWGIFECGGSANGYWQLCRLDEEAIFPGDDEAWAHVVAKVAEGSAYHRSALDYIRAHNPIEWASFGIVHGEPLIHPNGRSMLDDTNALVDQDGERILSDRRPLRFPPNGGPRIKPAPENPLDKLVSIHNEKGTLSIETESGVPVAISTEQFPIDDLRTLFRQFAAARGMEQTISDAIAILEPAAMVAESHGATETAAILRETLASHRRAISATV